jgi:hypothetical protein
VALDRAATAHRDRRPWQSWGQNPSLDGNDLAPAKPRTQSATRHREVVPSADLIPMQFKMPSDFVKAFKAQAATNGMKLDELLKACFDAFMKTGE